MSCSFPLHHVCSLRHIQKGLFQFQLDNEIMALYLPVILAWIPVGRHGRCSNLMEFLLQKIYKFVNLAIRPNKIQDCFRRLHALLLKFAFHRIIIFLGFYWLAQLIFFFLISWKKGKFGCETGKKKKKKKKAFFSKKKKKKKNILHSLFPTFLMRQTFFIWPKKAINHLFCWIPTAKGIDLPQF